MDKVIGASFVDAIDIGESLLVTSGRVSSDSVVEAIRGGTPALATRRFMIGSAAESAVKAGITVAARLI